MLDPEVGRPPGAQGDAPEDLLDPELGERRAHVVVLADRDPAGDHDEVGIERPRRAPRGWPRACHGRSRAGAARRPRARRRARRAVNAFELRIRSGAQRLARGLELVAGGQHRDPRPSRACDLGTADRGDHTDLGGADLGSRPRSTVSPASMSSPARRTSLPRLDRDPDLDRLARRRRCPRPGPRRRRRRAASRRSRSRSPRRRRAREPPGGRPATRRRPSSATGPAPAGVGGADRVAVHRRVVETGHRVGADDVLGERPAERVGDRDRLRAERRRALEHQPAGGVDLERGCATFPAGG